MARRSFTAIVLLALVSALRAAAPHPTVAAQTPADADHGGYRPQFYTDYGMDTVGGRGDGSATPKIIRVTSLADADVVTPLGDGTYSGTFRGALQATGPRFVVFEVSGYIDVASEIAIRSPYLTVAGQTAPSPGITIRMTGGFQPGVGASMIAIYTHDVVFQHFRIRPGDATCNSGILNAAFYGVNHNIVFDHMSISWAQDENVNLGNDARDVTMWRSISSEALYLVRGSGSCPGGGLSAGSGVGIGTGSRSIAVLQSILAKNTQRNPQDGGRSSIYVNNLIYGWQSHAMVITNDAIDSGGTYPWSHSAVGNLFVVGPYTHEPGFGASLFSYIVNGTFPERPGNAIYRAGNAVDRDAHPWVPVMEEYNTLTYDPNVDVPPEPAPLVTGMDIMPASAVEAFTKAHAGARPLDRDSTDVRLMQEITARAGLRLSAVADVGGYPALPSHWQPFSVPANPFEVIDPIGRTNLEHYLESLANALEP